MAARAQKSAPTIEEVKEKAKKERKEESKKMKFREMSIIDYLKTPKNDDEIHDLAYNFRFKESENK